MTLTDREFWTGLHGMIFGAGFLLAFAGGVVGLSSLRPEWITADGNKASMRRVMFVTWAMAVLAWATVLLGTYLIYPWYRAQPPPGVTALCSGVSALVFAIPGGNGRLAPIWHGVEGACGLVRADYCHRGRLCRHPPASLLCKDARLRRMLLILFSISFFCAAIAGFFGALINKAATVR